MSNSSIFSIFKKSVDKTLAVKEAITEKYHDLTETPVIMDFRDFYTENEYHINKISCFSKQAMNSINGVLTSEKKPTVITYFKCAEEIKNNFSKTFRNELVAEIPWTFDYCDEWLNINPYFSFVGPLLEKKYPDKIIIEPTQQENKPRKKKKKGEEEEDFGSSRILLMDGFVIYWSQGCLQVGKEGAAEAKALIRDIFWEKNGNQCEVRPNKDHNGYTVGEAIKEDFVQSDRARQLSEYLTKFLDKNISRSILFYGPPGTGKSNIVKNISHVLGQRTLRLNFSDIRPLQGFINDWVSICKPDVIILEDIDHSDSGGEAALTTLEKMNKSCKLLLATANAVSRLNDALVRPGRFDELMEINRMDDQVLLGIVGGDQEIFELVREFPIASTMELMKRIDALGKEAAIKTIGDIRQRFKNMKKRYNCSLDPDGDEDFSEPDALVEMTASLVKMNRYAGKNIASTEEEAADKDIDEGANDPYDPSLEDEEEEDCDSSYQDDAEVESDDDGA